MAANSVCQRREWKLHKGECKVLSSKPRQEKQRLQTPTLRLMVRLLVKRRLLSDGVSVGAYFIERKARHIISPKTFMIVKGNDQTSVVAAVISFKQYINSRLLSLRCKFEGGVIHSLVLVRSLPPHSMISLYPRSSSGHQWIHLSSWRICQPVSFPTDPPSAFVISTLDN